MRAVIQTAIRAARDLRDAPWGGQLNDPRTRPLRFPCLIRSRDAGVDSVIRCSAFRLLVITAAAALVPALAGCAAGLNAQTSQPFTPTDGAGTVFHGIAIRNVFVLGPGVNGTLQPGQAAGLFLALVNDGAPDRLTAVSAFGTAASVTILGGPVNLPVQQPAPLTGPAPEVILNGLTRPLVGGQSIPIALTFQNAGTIAMIIPVMPRVNFYTTFSPPAPSPTPTPTARAPRSPLPSATNSTGSPRATPSPTATP
jgi:copper(I)-binding protein